MYTDPKNRRATFLTEWHDKKCRFCGKEAEAMVGIKGEPTILDAPVCRKCVEKYYAGREKLLDECGYYDI
jgi:hypothetical protein